MILSFQDCEHQIAVKLCILAPQFDSLIRARHESKTINMNDKLTLQAQTPNRPGKMGPTANIIASLHASIMAFLRAVLQDGDKIEYEMKHFRALERSAAILLFWGSEHGVGNGDIDRALQNSDFFRDTVVQVLLSIGVLLSQGL